MTASAKQKTPRQKDLAKIHIAKKQLGMDEDVYRDMLLGVAGVRSAADLNARGRREVLRHLTKVGFKGFRPAKRKAGKPALGMAGKFPGRPAQSFFEDPDIGKMLGKIEALLAEAKRPWSYAHETAKNISGIDRVQWCKPFQVHRVVAALMYDAKRHGRYLGN